MNIIIIIIIIILLRLIQVENEDHGLLLA